MKAGGRIGFDNSLLRVADTKIIAKIVKIQ
jgi:hypothetical protein